MQNKDIFKELIKKLERQKKGLADPRIMHPKREWATGIIVMIVLFLGSAVWSAQMYLKNRNVTMAEVPADGVVVYREAVVTDVLAKFAEINQRYQAITNTVPVPDNAVELATSTPSAEEDSDVDVSEANTTQAVTEEIPEEPLRAL
jgi:hypothetical protein